MNTFKQTLTCENTRQKLDAVVTANHLGVCIEVEGSQTALGGDDLMLELRDGKVVLNVWANSDSEDPSHVIDLSVQVPNLPLANLKEGELVYWNDPAGECSGVQKIAQTVTAESIEDLDAHEITVLLDNGEMYLSELREPSARELKEWIREQS